MDTEYCAFIAKVIDEKLIDEKLIDEKLIDNINEIKDILYDNKIGINNS